ncbi:MAG: hybrid sensor histidine kinase/response regulator [Proteobacteria bacterium]|nr:hybrid sensor histidine kinase/response regulator [Pseudomonadota bacterium]MDA1325916.1 hybrid sensor histidine kinase/response regulator [Pseudomonadota bacterium]
MIDNPSSYANALILVVDDEATQRLLTRDTLEQEGVRVEEASSGEEGLVRIRELRPDLVMLDVMMPGMDGFAVCRQVRADPAISDTPVIIVTGREDIEDIRKGFEAGATDFLTKPLIWNLLPNRIRYVLRTSRLERELRIAKKVAEKANEAKSALLSTMGHELRTPLNAIIGFSDIMRQAALGPVGLPQYEEYVIHINDSGNRLLNAINDILEIVSCESGTPQLNQNDVGAVGLVDWVVKKVAPNAEAAGVQIVNDVSDDGVSISGDEKRLQRALFNLASNAVKFTERGGIVRIRMTVSDKGGLAFSIADNGIGISAEDLPRVMEPFEQANSSLARDYEGLGLGIPLARAMAWLHGGAILYESELGKGTPVRMTLPADRITSVPRDASNIRSA